MASLLLFPICLCLILRALRKRFLLHGRVNAAKVTDWTAIALLLGLPLLALAGLPVVAPGYLHSMGASGRWALASGVFFPVAIGLAIKTFIDLKV